jgi:hypothetical protein
MTADPVISTSVSFHDKPVMEAGTEDEVEEVDRKRLAMMQKRREQREHENVVKRYEYQLNLTFMFPPPCGRRPDIPAGQQGFLFLQHCGTRRRKEARMIPRPRLL